MRWHAHGSTGRLFLIAILGASTVTCRQNSTTPTDLGSPQITTISPSIVSVSTAPQVMTFTGVNFLGTYSLVMIAPGGVTTELQPSDLHVLSTDSFEVPLMLASPGLYAFEVKSPTGELSNAFDLAVGDVAGLPMINSVTPSAVHATAQAQSLAISGSGFTQGLTILLAGPDGNVSVVSGPDIGSVTDTMFQANLLLNKIGSYLVSVVNPSGDISNPYPIAVTR